MSDKGNGRVPSLNPESYLYYKSKLPTDTLHLDTEFEQVAVFMQEVTESAAEAALIEKTCKVALTETMAEIARKLREEPLGNGKTRSESSINSELVIYPEVQAAQTAVLNAGYDNDLWQGLVSSFRSKGSAMKSAAELFVVGYVTRDHLDNARRSEVREASAKISTRAVTGA